LLKLLPLGAFLYLVFPEALIGYFIPALGALCSTPFEDYAIVAIGTTMFVHLCPPAVVNEHRRAIMLDVQVRRGEIEPPSAEPASEDEDIVPGIWRVVRDEPLDPQPTPPQPRRPERRILTDWHGKIRIVVDPQDEWVVFRFNNYALDVLKANRQLWQDLKKLGELRDDALMVKFNIAPVVLNFIREDIGDLYQIPRSA
jgi:hypothetical protein